MKSKQNIVIILFIILSCGVKSQIKDIGLPFSKNYTKQKYKAGTQNWDIIQDSKGLMYFANNDGILEYDGSGWQTIKVSNQSIVRALALGNDGKIYAGASHEIGYLETMKNGSLQYKSLTALIPERYQNFNEIWKVYQTSFGIVFQSYSYIFIYNNGKIQVVSPLSKFDFSFYTNGIYYAVDKENGIFIIKNGKLIPFINNQAFVDNEVRFILPYQENKLMIGTINRGIYILDDKKLSPWNNQINEQLISNRLFSGIKLKKGVYAFGSIQEGLFISDEEGKIIQHINRSKGLPNNTVLSLFTDSSDNLWMGLDNGISYCELSSPFTWFNFYYGIETGYTSIVYHNILYIGTNQGLFARSLDQLSNKSGADNKFKLIEGSQGQVWNLTLIEDKLFCGHNDGTYIVDGFTIKQITGIRGCWTFIQPAQNKDKIICGTYKGLIEFEKEKYPSGKWKFSKQIKGFDESCKKIIEDNDHTLWISHGYKGIFRITLNTKKDSVIKIKHFSEKDGLPQTMPITMGKIDNEIFFNTSKEIYVYNYKTELFESSSKYNTFFRVNKNLYQVTLDEQSNIWYFSNKEMGVYRFLEDGTYKEINIPFRKISNLLISEYEHVYTYNNKNIFIGTQEGIIHYDPTISKDYNQHYNAFIREIHILNTKNDSILSYKDNATTNTNFFRNLVNLPYRFNSLMFKFSAASYDEPEKLEYRFRLIGYDDNFSLWDQRNIKEYTNLHEGTYTFEVQARNIYQRESLSDKYTFHINPPFYRSKIAYLVYILLLSMGIYYTVKRIQNSKRRDQLKHNKKMIMQEQQFREEALLAEKEIERLRNETLKNEMKHKNKELANSTMHLIQKNKFLTIVKNEIVNITSQSNDDPNRSSLNMIVKRIDKDLNNEKYWKVFDSYFDEVHQDFLTRMKSKHPDLSPKELKLSAYLRMNISTKEIATLMNISIRGVEVSRYRLRKKLNIVHDTNLTEYVLNF